MLGELAERFDMQRRPTSGLTAGGHRCRSTAPLRQRDFRLLWTGMSVSLLGDGIFLVAVAWQAYALANHPSSLAYVGVALSLPQVVMLLVGGAVSDRVRRQTVLFWADVARAAAVGALAAVTASGRLQLWELISPGPCWARLPPSPHRPSTP